MGFEQEFLEQGKLFRMKEIKYKYKSKQETAIEKGKRRRSIIQPTAALCFDFKWEKYKSAHKFMKYYNLAKAINCKVSLTFCST